MSNLSRFLKANKIQKENTTYPATKSLLDEEGKPLKWEIRPITTEENDEIRDRCTVDVQVTGKPNMFRPKLKTSDYIAELMVAAIVHPNLNNSTLQDSYGAKQPQKLIKKIIDDPGEYSEFANFIQNYNGFKTSMKDKVEQAKN